MAFTSVRYDEVIEYLKSCSTNRLHKVLHDVGRLIDDRAFTGTTRKSAVGKKAKRNSSHGW